MSSDPFFIYWDNKCEFFPQGYRCIYLIILNQSVKYWPLCELYWGWVILRPCVTTWEQMKPQNYCYSPYILLVLFQLLNFVWTFVREVYLACKRKFKIICFKSCALSCFPVLQWPDEALKLGRKKMLQTSYFQNLFKQCLWFALWSLK